MKQLEYSSRNSRLLALELDIKASIFDPMKCTAKVANAAGISERTKHLHLSYQKIRMQIIYVNVGREQTLTVSKTVS